MYCQNCGTKFEANSVKLDIKALSNLSPKYSKCDIGDGSYTYYKIAVGKVSKREDIVELHVNYSKVSIVAPTNNSSFLRVSLDLNESYKATRHIESLIELGSTEAIISHIQTSILYGDEITEEEYEQAKAKASAILDFAKSHA